VCALPPTEGPMAAFLMAKATGFGGEIGSSAAARATAAVLAPRLDPSDANFCSHRPPLWSKIRPPRRLNVQSGTGDMPCFPPENHMLSDVDTRKR
jgi:hypothetical protein